MKRWIRSLFPAVRRPVSRLPRLALVSLEDRAVPATFIVSSLASGGANTLLQAIINANGTTEADTITFDPAIFNTAKTIFISGDLVITNPVTITGPAAKVTVNANKFSRIFNTDPAPSGTVITINGLSLTNGYTISNGNGGAILAGDETLNLVDCTVTSSQATSRGGAIFIAGGVLNLTRSTISGNSAILTGGGVSASGGSCVFLDSAIINNKTTGVSYNSFGGGFYFSGTPISSGLIIRNSTISGNSSTKASGGGIALSSTAPIIIQNTTISNNTSGGSRGGGIARVNGTGTMSIQSSIISGNTNTGSPDIYNTGAVYSSGSAIGSSLGFALKSSSGNRPFGENLKLRALADNGSGRPTHSIEFDSPVRNKGYNTGPTLDQRGQPRNDGSGVDMGAFELNTLVTNTLDTGDGSLRNAIAEANRVGGTDVVAFNASFTAPKTITLTTGELAFNSNAIGNSVTINGPGANLLTVSGNNASRIFNTDPANPADVFTFTDLTLAAGTTAGDGGAVLIGAEIAKFTNVNIKSSNASAYGGAIRVSSAGGSLTMTNCTVNANSAAFGGAIATNATVNLTNCTVNANSAASGGAIAANATVNLTDCTVNDNTAGSSRGAIQALSLTVNRTTISGNSAGDFAGGAYARNSMLIENSTVSGNTAKFGGGLGLGAGAGPFTVRNSTLANNTTTDGPGGAICLGFNAANPFVAGLTVQNATITSNTSNKGGGIDRYFGTGSITVDSSIISGNGGASNADISTNGSATVNYSAIGSSNGFTLVGGNNLPFGVDLKLGSLADNGGAVKTILPAMDSPVLSAGSNVGSLTTDARGSGFPRVLNTQADIGAVEAQIFVVRNTNDAGKDSLRAQLTDTNAFAGTQTITFDPALFSTAKTITLASTLSISDGVTITGPAGNTVTLSGNNAVRVMVATTSSGTLTLNNLNLVNGSTSNGGGPGLRVSTTNAVLNNCVVSGNKNVGTGAGATGGGIYASGSANTLTLNLCTISGNSAGIYGGGITAHTLLTLNGCTVENNTAGTRAGGVYARIMTMTNSTVRNNTAAVYGGGILLNNGTAFTGTFSITNSTITGNTAADGGGLAIGYNPGDGASSPLLLRNSTITANSASGSGGGLRLVDGTCVFTIDSTILSGNTAASGPDVSSVGTVNVNRSALGSTAGFTLTGANNLVGQNLKLGVLGNYGGPVATFPLLSGSPAINAGSNPGSLATDARGLPRVAGTAADIGAFEVQPAVIAFSQNTTLVNDSKVGPNGLMVKATFNMPMNPGVQPSIAFPAEFPAGSLTLTSGVWIDNFSWEAKFQVADLGTTLNDIDLQITGAQDFAAGVVSQPYTAVDAVDLDTQNAVIASITSTTPNGTYTAGQAVNITVNFSEPVTLTGTLNVTLDTGAVVSFAAQAGTSLSGIFTVAAGQSSPDLNVTAVALVGSSTLRDTATNASVLTLPLSNLASNKSIVVDTPTVTGFTVNDGNAQRSRLTIIVVNFSGMIDAATIAVGITLTRGDGTIVNAASGLIVTPASGMVTSLTLSFANISSAGIEYGSLADGYWRLAIPSLGYQSTLNDPALRRLYGDVNGDGTVDGANDFAAFGNVFGVTVANSPFDFNNDGTIDGGTDFAQFGARFGLTL